MMIYDENMSAAVTMKVVADLNPTVVRGVKRDSGSPSVNNGSDISEEGSASGKEEEEEEEEERDEGCGRKEFSVERMRELLIEHFDGLEALLKWLGKLSSLHSLELWDCENLMNLPTLEATQRLTNLRSLRTSGPHLKERCARESRQEWHKIAHIPSIHMF
ncbi:putative disease resistance protein RGA4 [Camellia lanceoleosa]|uniref:Disease resistance protein RGA4 n=1 Tax=Camellia lanceoleosa TaxID=1840588 RepID=A0ACC0FJ98_9ERIC|nr:putative disease resistance protein RGA4 [Camellia lanceoleosa]